MLKRMRWRLILAAMLAFFAVIFLVALLLNVVYYYSVTGRVDETISYIEDYEAGPPAEPDMGNPPGGPFMPLPDVEANYMTRFFIVRFDSEENVLSVSTDYVASVDENEAVQFARKVLVRGTERGYMKEYRYVRTDSADTVGVIFLNTSREQQDMKSLRNLTLVVAGGSLVLVFILVVLFSGRAIKPIENNIKQQKQFITDASHELKTPLTSISTSVDVIALEHGEDEWTENIRNQTERMTKLVSELVTLSRLDEDSPLPDKEHFSVSNAAWEIVEVYQSSAKADNRNLTVDIQEDVSYFGDKNSIQQMLSVLLDNAVRYSPPNGEIRFSLAGKRNRVQIEVFNTCDYARPPDVSRLFDRFYRPDSSRDTNTGGTGVGLAIARAVAEAHGGTIGASCPDGKSMTIRVTL